MVALFKKVLLLCLSLIWITPAAANWMRATSDHFIIYGEMKESEIRAFAERLERYDAVLHHVIPSNQIDPSNPVTVFAMNSDTEIQKLSGRANVGGFYEPGLSGDFAYVQKDISEDDDGSYGRAVLFHEYTHHYMYHYIPSAYPSWYIEGFAELYATTEISRDGKITVGKLPKFRMWGLLKSDFPLIKMLNISPDRLNGEDADAYYAKAWFLAHYLTFDKARAGQLGLYLGLYRNGLQQQDAAVQAFGDLRKLSRDVDLAIDQPLRVREITGIMPDLSKTKVERLTDSESALMPLTIRRLHGAKPNDVEPFLRDALVKLHAYPQEPMALAAAAEGNLDARHLDEATRINDLLLTMQPDNAEAMLRRARIAAAHIGGGHDPEAWAAFRKIVVKANHLSSNDPYALYEYYHSYTAAGELPTQIAIDGLWRALDLAPQADEVRVSLASEMIRLGKGAERDVLVAPMLNDPHAPQSRRLGRALKDAPLGKYPDMSLLMPIEFPDPPKK